ncbi:MAG: hypothetical protein IKY27_00240 [Bacteroidales bacterium]|nr:hypothetical protein [Bacteroidales bacterium]
MDKMIGYIFGELGTNSNDIKNLKRVINNQAGVIKVCRFGCMVAVAYSTYAICKGIAAKHEVEALKKKVADLENQLNPKEEVEE